MMDEHGARRDGPGLAGRLVDPCLCLDFANTVAVHDGTSPYDYLASYADLIAWSHDAGVLTEQEAAAQQHEGERRAAEAAACLRDAVALREVIYRLFSNRILGAAPSDADVATLNDALSTALQQMRLTPTLHGVGWEWAAHGTHDAAHGTHDAALDRMLWPVAASAAALLTAAEADKVRECAGHACTWLFLDTTKNHSRRYCRAEGCGNRARARRHYARTRAATHEQP